VNLHAGADDAFTARATMAATSSQSPVQDRRGILTVVPAAIRMEACAQQ